MQYSTQKNGSISVNPNYDRFYYKVAKNPFEMKKYNGMVICRVYYLN